MTAHTPIEYAESSAHGAAVDAVNRWRGHCVECFARLEHEVTITLSVMAAMPKSNVKVPHNFGEKVKALGAAIASSGEFSRPKLAKALKDFSDHLDRRNMLIHASGRVWIDNKGDWLWRYRFDPSGKGKSLETDCFEGNEALAIEKSLARGTQSLGGQLRALREELEAVTE